MGKETRLVINLFCGAIVFLAGLYIMIDRVSFLAAIILMVVGVFMMCMSGKGFKKIDKDSEIHYIRD
jgi:O-antigen/teichoic acid export membrane protein